MLDGTVGGLACVHTAIVHSKTANPGSSDDDDDDDDGDDSDDDNTTTTTAAAAAASTTPPHAARRQACLQQLDCASVCATHACNFHFVGMAHSLACAAVMEHLL